jgi:DNA-binding response OmpR family regulator
MTGISNCRQRPNLASRFAMQTKTQEILIVECDLPTLELYLRELSRDYQILACSETQQALALLQAHSVAAVVLEPSTPDGQGWSLLAAIKSLPGSPPIPVVLCSTLDERKRGMEMGAAAYLVKPVLPTTLLKTLRQVMRRN